MGKISGFMGDRGEECERKNLRIAGNCFIYPPYDKTGTITYCTLDYFWAK
jgi:hypothetical protein